MNDEAGPQYKCAVCFFQFHDFDKFQRHQTVCSEMVLTNQVFPADTSQTVETHIKKQSYGCVVCKKCFKTEKLLTKHSISHSDEKPYRCNICGTSLRRKGDWQRHISDPFSKTPFHILYTCKAFQSCECVNV